MQKIAVLGASFGDEGKGKVVHDFSPNYDWVVRFSGGANAGHTIYRDSVKYVHNLLPSFDWRSTKPKAFLGSGMVIDLFQLLKEVESLYIVSPEAVSRIYVDPEAFLVMPEHKVEDKANNGHIGSTNRGIGPAYASKISRKGLRIRDIILNPDLDSEQTKALNKIKYLGVNFIGVLKLREDFLKSSIIFEGAQGVMLDINHGTYPYVSCGEATIAGIYSAGFSFIKLDKVYGVIKCYTTKVGEGPFPTEIHGKEADFLRELGQEYGATTGRPRRIGWIDLPSIKYAVLKSGITNLIITKLDILNGLDIVPACYAYDDEPTCPADFFSANPRYIEVAGWKDAKLSYVSDKSEILPFIQTVESNTGCNVEYISFGVQKEDLVKITTQYEIRY